MARSLWYDDTATGGELKRITEEFDNIDYDDGNTVHPNLSTLWYSDGVSTKMVWSKFKTFFYPGPVPVNSDGTNPYGGDIGQWLEDSRVNPQGPGHADNIKIVVPAGVDVSTMKFGTNIPLRYQIELHNYGEIQGTNSGDNALILEKPILLKNFGRIRGAGGNGGQGGKGCNGKKGADGAPKDYNFRGPRTYLGYHWRTDQKKGWDDICAKCTKCNAMIVCGRYDRYYNYWAGGYGFRNNAPAHKTFREWHIYNPGGNQSGSIYGWRYVSGTVPGGKGGAGGEGGDGGKGGLASSFLSHHSTTPRVIGTSRRSKQLQGWDEIEWSINVPEGCSDSGKGIWDTFWNYANTGTDRYACGHLLRAETQNQSTNILGSIPSAPTPGEPGKPGQLGEQGTVNSVDADGTTIYGNRGENGENGGDGAYGGDGGDWGAIGQKGKSTPCSSGRSGYPAGYAIVGTNQLLSGSVQGLLNGSTKSSL